MSVMNMEFQNKAPDWRAEGTEPPDTLKARGFEAGYKPPADYFNWFWNTVSKCISEIQNSAAGKSVKITESESVNEHYGEIFNNYTSNKATGWYSHAEGMESKASGHSSHAEGYGNSAVGDYSHAEGFGNYATGMSSHAEGENNGSSGQCSHAEGENNKSSGRGSHAEGENNKSSGQCSHAGGSYCESTGKNSFSHGSNVLSNENNFCIGKYNKTPDAASESTNTGDLFVIGSGLESAKSNAFRVTAAGAVMGTQEYTATGADFAEAFEWLDGNPDNEDRRGLFVTLDGEKIRPATADDDYIAGVVSAAPTVVGDAHTDDWQGKYVTDVFGERVLENEAWKLSDNFDETKDDNYTGRLERPEWSAVGLVGKLVVVDDGTCQVNGYCYPSENGIAAAAKSGYRVMARIDDNHVRVLLK